MNDYDLIEKASRITDLYRTGPNGMLKFKDKEEMKAVLKQVFEVGGDEANLISDNGDDFTFIFRLNEEDEE